MLIFALRAFHPCAQDSKTKRRGLQICGKDGNAGVRQQKQESYSMATPDCPSSRPLPVDPQVHDGWEEPGTQDLLTQREGLIADT